MRGGIPRTAGTEGKSNKTTTTLDYITADTEQTTSCRYARSHTPLQAGYNAKAD